MARKNLSGGFSTNNTASQKTPSIAPSANHLVLAFVLNVNVTTSPAPLPSASGNGLTWQQVQTVTIGSSNDRRLTCFRAMGPAPTGGRLTFNFSTPQDVCAWSVFEYDGVDTSGSNGSGAVARVLPPVTVNGQSLSVPVGTIGSNDNIIVGGMILDLFNEVKPVSKDPEFSQIDGQLVVQTLGKGGTLQTQDKVGAAASVDWSWLGAENAAAIVLELKAVGVGSLPQSSIEALARRFEPILYFHKDERFFPSDAKRYIEASALWKATPAFDSKMSWSRLVHHDKLAALKDEAAAQGDVPLEDPPNLNSTGSEEHFFELTGWKDGAEVPEADVSTTSGNVYSNRTAIATLYNNPDVSGGRRELRESRFWYHAELFDLDHLRGLLQADVNREGPNLPKLLESFRDPHILCYYMFFPAHDDAPLANCTSIASKELASFAGEWACIALLLDRDNSAVPFEAKFIGHTGRRLAKVTAPDGSLVYPPHAFDPEERFAMKVNRFKPGSGPQAKLPETIGDHPKLFVALGTHSLYLTSGTQVVDPYPPGKNPAGCGAFDAPYPGTSGTPGNSAAVLIIKGILTLGIGMLFEDYGSFGEAGAANDTAGPDESPAAGTGKTLRPANLPIPDAGDEIQDWRAGQGVVAGGRSYDFLVDRSRQVWWPSEDGKPSFRGRWGPRVQTDPFNRRDGMTFPDFWHLFLLGIANAQANPVVGP